MLARQVKIEVQCCDDDDQVGDECVDSLRLSTAGILNRAKTNSQNVKVLLFPVVQITL